MKMKSFIMTLILASLAISGLWSNNSVTDFYYYKFKPYNLNVRTNKVFIKTKDIVSESSYRNILGKYFRVSRQSKFDSNIREQFIDLVSPADNSALVQLVAELKTDPQVELASVVYSPTDNDKVLQGLEDQVIAQFKPQVTGGQIAEYLAAHNYTIVKQLEISGGTTYILKVSANTSLTTIESANSIYESGLVNFCDPDFYYFGLLSYIPNDTYFAQQWSVRNLGNNVPGGITGTAGCDMKVDSAWNNTLGTSKCIVAMVDSGIDTTHPDIIGNMTHGANWDFINGHAGCYDDYNHGTCTAGIVAATGNNSLGCSGICPQAKLLGVKIFNSGGSTSTTALTQGLTWSWNQGEWISSNSWGGGSPVSAADATILDGVTNGRGGKGTVFLIASGNGNGAIQWPSTNPNVIAVGGNSPCNQRKTPSSCDNENWWGASYGTGLSVVAPCVKVYAADRQGSNGYSGTDYYDQFNGTSSATPNAAGVVALGLSRDSTRKWDTVRSRLCWTADKIGSYSYTSAGPYSMLGSTWNNEMGYGKINANRFVNSFGAPPPPLTHNIACGPFKPLPAYFLINNTYAIKTQVSNPGATNETGVPVKWFINNTLTQTTNVNLNVNAVDSVSNNWTPTSAGSYTLMYVSALATDLDRTNDTVRVTVNVLSSLPALCEDFTSATFPPTNWTLTNGGSYWTRQTVSSFGVGTGSARYNMWTAPAGTDQALVTLLFNPVNSGASVFVDMAFSPYPATAPYNQDSLIILASTNGGTTYTSLARLGPTQLATAPASSSQFTPTAAQWVKRSYSLPTGTNMIQFLGRSAFGDDLFLDSICVNNPLGVSNNGNTIPQVYSLAQNYPNPFNPATNIRFGLPKSGLVKMVIYDVLGRVVTTLVNEYKEAGTYTVDFDASAIASGVYFYRIESGSFTDVKKMLLVK